MVNMLFVYSLSYDGNVFYIGCTKDLAQRYKQHLYGHSCSHSMDTISKLSKSDIIIKMNVLYYLPYKEAIQKENEVIRLFTKAGHNLSNSLGNIFNDASWKWDKPPININNKTMPKYLSMLQRIKEYYFKWHNNIKSEFPDKEYKELYEQTTTKG